MQKGSSVGVHRALVHLHTYMSIRIHHEPLESFPHLHPGNPKSVFITGSDTWITDSVSMPYAAALFPSSPVAKISTCISCSKRQVVHAPVKSVKLSRQVVSYREFPHGGLKIPSVSEVLLQEDLQHRTDVDYVRIPHLLPRLLVIHLGLR